MTDASSSQPLKVLQIIKSLGRGGAETLLVETLRLHNQQLFSFQYIYFLPWKHQLVQELESKGVSVTCLAARTNFQMLLKIPELIRFLKRNKIDVVHAHLPWAGLVARLACRLAGVPLIYTEHNKQDRYHRATKWLNKITFGWQQLAIAVSSDVQESIQSHIGKRVPVQTILNGIDTHKFDRQPAIALGLRSQLGLVENELVMGTMAVFRKQKRLDIWLDVFAILHKQFPNLKGVIVGDGPLKETLLEKAIDLKIADSIHFVGLQTNAVNWLSVMDVFLMTSDFEGLPLALLEAMSCQCAVVSTKAGGIAEVIEHQVDGLLCDIGAKDQLVAALHSVLSNELFRKQLGISGRKKVQQHFSLNRMVKELEEVYITVGKGL